MRWTERPTLALTLHLDNNFFIFVLLVKIIYDLGPQPGSICLILPDPVVGTTGSSEELAPSSE